MSRAVGKWDNRCTHRYAVNDYSERRVVQQVVVLGDDPQGSPPVGTTTSRSACSLSLSEHTQNPRLLPPEIGTSVMPADRAPQPLGAWLRTTPHCCTHIG